MAKDVNRRDFVSRAVGAGVALSVVKAVRPARARVLGANERINLGVIGVGGRGRYLIRQFMEVGQKTGDVQIVAVSDVYETATWTTATSSTARTLTAWSSAPPTTGTRGWPSRP